MQQHGKRARKNAQKKNTQSSLPSDDVDDDG